MSSKFSANKARQLKVDFANRKMLLLENVAALLSTNDECRKLFNFIVKER